MWWGLQLRVSVHLRTIWREWSQTSVEEEKLFVFVLSMKLWNSLVWGYSHFYQTLFTQTPLQSNKRNDCRWTVRNFLQL